MDKFKIAQRLAKLRTLRNLVQKQVAAHCGLKRSAYAFYVEGRAEPSIKTLIALSQLYDCSIDELLGLKENSN